MVWMKNRKAGERMARNDISMEQIIKEAEQEIELICSTTGQDISGLPMRKRESALSQLTVNHSSNGSVPTAMTGMG